MWPLNAIHSVHLALDVVTWATAIEPNIFVEHSKGIYECWQLSVLPMHEYIAFYKLHTSLNLCRVIPVYHSYTSIGIIVFCIGMLPKDHKYM